MIFMDASTQGDSQTSGTWTHSDRQLHISCLELKAVVFVLRHWVSVLRGHQVLITLENYTVVSQQTRRDPFPSLVTSSSGSLYVAAGSGQSSQSQAHCRLFEHNSGPPIQTQSAYFDRVESTFRDCQSDFSVLGNSKGGHVCNSPQYPPILQFMSPIPEPQALAVDALSLDWQGRSLYMFPPFPLFNKVIQKLRAIQAAEVTVIAPWWPSQPWFPHLLRLCVDQPLFFPYSRDLLSQQSQRFTSDGKSYHLPAWRHSTLQSSRIFRRGL